MRHCMLVGLVAGAVGLLASCTGDATGTDRYRVSVTTDRAQYSLARASIASITLHNPSDAPVYLPMGMYVFYQQRENGSWGEATPWFIVDGTGPSFPVAPGASMTDRLQLRFYLGTRPGTYRIQYRAYADAQLRHELPLTQRVSAPFTVSP
jgi:hypothetical protein